MGLKIEPEEFLNRLVLVQPQYGWGWSLLDGQTQDAAPIDFQSIHDAGAFRIKIKRFFSYNNELRGFCGKIEEPRHKFDGLWIVCSTRVVGDFNFTDNPCPGYDVQISSVEPQGIEWPKIPQGNPLYMGYGSVNLQELP